MMLARRHFLAQTGGICIAFTLPGIAAAQTAPARPGGASAPETNPVAGSGQPTTVDGWLAIDRAGTVTVHFGKVELGTGIATAVSQIVADELDVPVASVSVGAADTSDTPDQGYTAGSASLSVGAVPVRQAAAEARLAIIDLAAAKFGVAADRLVTADGAVSVRGENRRATYGELVNGQALQADDRQNDEAQAIPTRIASSAPRCNASICPEKYSGRFRTYRTCGCPGCSTVA